MFLQSNNTQECQDVTVTDAICLDLRKRIVPQPRELRQKISEGAYLHRTILAWSSTQQPSRRAGVTQTHWRRRAFLAAHTCTALGWRGNSTVTFRTGRWFTEPLSTFSSSATKENSKTLTRTYPHTCVCVWDARSQFTPDQINILDRTIVNGHYFSTCMMLCSEKRAFS